MCEMSEVGHTLSSDSLSLYNDNVSLLLPAVL